MEPLFKFYNHEFELDENEHSEQFNPPIQPDRIENVYQLLEFIEYLKTSGHWNLSNTYRRLVTIQEPLENLAKMIGMERVKSDIIYQILYYVQRDPDAKNDDYLHTAIYGAPGSGKTSLAHILKDIYLKLGILKNNVFSVGRRDNLIAGYVGQTAQLTTKFLKSCIGGVAVIDEVYQLGHSAKDANRDTFAKECIDTINQFASEHKHEIAIIICGYEDDVKKCFFSQNKGLERRFQWQYRIEPYTAEELLRIFTLQAENQGFYVGPLTMSEKFFESNMEYFKWGGGDTENFLDKCKKVHYRNTLVDTSGRYTLSVKDIEDGFKMFVAHKFQADSDSEDGDVDHQGVY
jgi:SpoVK/Ycf46/Vps4 family AAA+-type ATPase